jgi:diguanylate cyclase (GGDEF)-like protein
MRIFVLREPQDYVLKPLCTWAIFLLTYTMWEFLLIGWTPANFADRLLAVSLTQIPFMVIAFVLVIHLHQMQSGLAGLALTDVLTGLPNRRAFIGEVSDYQKSGDIGYLLIIDADHFKQINDTHGHAVGDICLQAIADRLQSLKSSNDAIGRIGGEEFGVYLPYSTKENLLRLGQRMCREIIVPSPDGGAPLRFTLSVGAAETRQDEKIETALARADEALYVAKENGRARMELWTRTMTRAA